MKLKDYEYYRTDKGVLYCGDCLSILPLLEDKSIDLVLTDPPYGINADKGVGGFGSSKETAKKYEDNWDNNRPDKKVFDIIISKAKKCIIFGGNFFTDILSQGNHWIVWDKVGEMKFDNPFSKCELAWTNIDKNTINKYVVIQQGFVAKEKERFHPTQKPVSLFSSILLDYSIEQDLILDCFLGSGTTALASEKLGRKWVGIELSEFYCRIAKQRIQNEYNQLKMF